MFADGAATAPVASASGIYHTVALGKMLKAPDPSVRSIHGYTMEKAYNWAGDWVGIGRATSGDDTLVQAGTDADNMGGTAVYDAWTEVLPAAEFVLPGLTIRPGDVIKTVVKETSRGVWKMKVKDKTTGQVGTKTVDYSSSGNSVEAIHERPCIEDGCTSVSDFATLSETNNVTFDPGKYSVSPAGTPVFKPLLMVAADATIDQIWMMNNAGNAYIAATSNPDSDNDGFTVAYGSTQPPPPAS